MAATGGVQRQLTLPPAPDSARHARRLVNDVCATARADEFADTAVLLTSELVTNGIVHAHTDLEVVVEATPGWVRVEVGDDNPHLPARRDYDEQAMTGRGLEMVELLADDFGIEGIQGDGKRVWFRLGMSPGTPEPERVMPARRALTPFRLELPGLPVDLYCVWQMHADALLREATICALDEDPPRMTGGYPMAGEALAALADAARDVFRLRDAGIAVADVTLHIAREAVPWFPILRDALQRAGLSSEAGQLLVPTTLPEMRALRDWVCDEVARQTAGLRPMPWSGVLTEDSAPTTASAEALASVRASSSAMVAADSTNRILAVSRPTADLLGWEPDELEGHRLVTIIPTRLRDRHVAGFTRHLLEGTRTIIGRPVELPALRRDGVEVPVTLLIERRPDPVSHVLFVATLTPVPPRTEPGSGTGPA